MESMSNKRNIREILPTELLGKLRSKADFYMYLDKHVSTLISPHNLSLVVILYAPCNTSK